jgi:hypothetical protein
MIVPCIPAPGVPWKVQWYGKWPVSGNWRVTVAPLPSERLNVAVEAGSFVTVWVTPSPFCHATVVPAVTVSVTGEKATPPTEQTFAAVGVQPLAEP